MVKWKFVFTSGSSHHWCEKN